MNGGDFDIQVNGYGGIDYQNENLTAEELHESCRRLQADGVDGILATIVTDHVPQMCRRLERIAVLREADPLARQMIAGFHIEGPFMNETPGYRGAHPPEALHPVNLDELKLLIDATRGLTKLFTLSPERDPGMQGVRWLASQGVVVSAGHTDASLDQLKAATDAGLSMFTHLGNGCPMQMHRHDNIINRVLSLSDRFWLCFIADGVHVPFFLLQNFLRLVGLEKTIIVTDAMAAAGFGPGRFKLGRWDLLIGEDLAARAPDGSHLVGSAMSMPRVHQNLRDHLHLSDADIRRLTTENPRRAIRC